MSFVSWRTVWFVHEPFDIGPIDTLVVVETLKINCSHLHEIGLPESTFGRLSQCGFRNGESGMRLAECGLWNAKLGKADELAMFFLILLKAESFRLTADCLKK